jgi:hypothetical protein
MILLEATCPGLRLRNAANGSHGHWATRAKAAKRQRHAPFAALLAEQLRRMMARPTLPLVVTVTRAGPRALDAHDGLPNACKHFVDGVADYVGAKDHDPGYTWVYRQERGPYGARVTLARPA